MSVSLLTLQREIAAWSAKLAVIGLGYVGLPVACLFADAGFDVLGLDLKTDRVAAINARQCPIDGQEPGLAQLLTQVVDAGRLRATTDYVALRDRDAVLIAVETPVDGQHVPRYVALRGALRSLGAVLKGGALVIVESTIAPGTMTGVVKPLLEETSGRRVNAGFYLGHCPERVMPGRLLANLRGVSRVCGGETPETAAAMMTLYRHVVQADLDAADCVTAELVKTTENAYRDVNIAFANQVALICEAVGGDAWRVRELVNKSPGRHMLYPGAGVGGHCIPKDPWLLSYQAQQQGVQVPLIAAAREVNESMPLHIVDLLEDALAEAGTSLAEARVLVMGYAYLENSDDTRHSPSETLVSYLRERGVEVVIHDPYVPAYQGDLWGRVQGCDATVVMVKHDVYQTLDLGALKDALRTPVVVDGRWVFDAEEARAAGLIYRVVGKASETQRWYKKSSPKSCAKLYAGLV
jgi:UDP-N-acetyl-D-mannosaminuronic acid dehydrogenase